MRRRVLILLILLIFRFILGLIFTLNFKTKKEVSVTGYAINTYQNNINCTIGLGNFLIDSGRICAAFKGDKIKVIGTLERRLIDSFSGKLWLVTKKIEVLEKSQNLKESKTQNGRGVKNFREDLVNIYFKNVPSQEAGLVAGIVLGYKKGIDNLFYQRLIESGTVHIVVASGYNVLLVGGTFLSLLFWLFKRSFATVLAIGAMVFYALLAGGEAPVVRAVWMVGLLFTAKALGRASQPLWILSLTAWAMLIVDPTLLSSVSFHLSLAASFGLLVIEPYLSRKLEVITGGKPADLLSSLGIMTTISTMIPTMPILWWSFGRLSLIGILSNSMILPFVPPLMILGAGMLVLPQMFSVPAYVLAHWMVLVINFFGG